MQTVRITKIFNFEMAHALWKHEGQCKNIHGHSYKLYVTLSGVPINETGNPEDGMLMDFGKLKKLIKHNIIDEFDHTLIINSASPQAQELQNMHNRFDNVKIVDFQPTSENLIIHFAKIISKILPANVLLHSLKLYETETSYCEWFIHDQ